MNTDRNDDRELLELLAVESAREEGGDAPTDWSAVLGELRAETTAPSAGFNNALRRAWKAEATPTAAPKPRGRNWWRIAIPLAAAAGGRRSCLLWPGGVIDSRTGGGVVWADVVKAMDRVQQFHVIIFNDDPRRSDPAEKLLRLDIFYQQPDHWRAHGLGHVAFSTGGKRRTWSPKQRDFLENVKGQRTPDILPREFVDAHKKLGTLAGVLTTMFDGDVPKGEPVKSDEVASSQGIDVFDYAANASEKWARIWVLRESKLPLKMHLYYPDSDEFMLVTFDYSDPQPNVFFDADLFAAQAKRVQSDDPYRYYSIGSSPVAGMRPRAADQIHEVEGGYRAPKISRVVSNELGDVVIVTDDVKNLTPQGTRPHEQGYERITDTWGNRYLKVTDSSVVGPRGEHRWIYMPMPPFNRGTGPRQLTMSYVVQPRYGEHKELATETLDVPTTGATTKPQDWPKDLAAQKQFAWNQYLQRFGTVAEQLVEIDRSLAADAKNLSALAWKFRLLRKHGREPQAWTLFERDMRDRIFGEAKVLNDYYVEASQYLLYLAAINRTDELRDRSAAVRKILENAQKSAKDSKGSVKLYNLERVEHNPLYPATRVLEWREAYKNGPEIVRIIAGRDGLVFIELAIPKAPEGWASNGWDGEAPLGWFWQPTFGRSWQINARMAKLDTNRLWLVLRGDGKQIPISGEAMLALDNFNSKIVRHDAKIAWQRTVDVPEPTIDDVKPWWTKEAGNKGWWPLPAGNAQPAVVAQTDGVEQWMEMAKTFRDAGRYDQALPLFEKVIARAKGAMAAAVHAGRGFARRHGGDEQATDAHRASPLSLRAWPAR
jgi:hypothetical protein